jgi:hypothetical protein
LTERGIFLKLKNDKGKSFLQYYSISFKRSWKGNYWTRLHRVLITYRSYRLPAERKVIPQLKSNSEFFAEGCSLGTNIR